MFSVIGIVEFRDGLRLRIDNDFCRYYKVLIEKSLFLTKKYQIPAHGAHLTIYNPKIHGFISPSRLRKYAGQRDEIMYDPLYCIQGIRVDMFYFPAYSKLSETIKKELQINNGPNYHGDHITICNRKNNK